MCLDEFLLYWVLASTYLRYNIKYKIDYTIKIKYCLLYYIINLLKSSLMKLEGKWIDRILPKRITEYKKRLPEHIIAVFTNYKLAKRKPPDIFTRSDRDCSTNTIVVCLGLYFNLPFCKACYAVVDRHSPSLSTRCSHSYLGSNVFTHRLLLSLTA